MYRDLSRAESCPKQPSQTKVPLSWRKYADLSQSIDDLFDGGTRFGIDNAAAGRADRFLCLRPAIYEEHSAARRPIEHLHSFRRRRE